MNLKEWRGFKGKTPCLPPLSTGKQGRGCPGRRRPWAGGPGARRRPQEKGKRAGRHWGPIPSRSSARGGSGRPGHGGRRPTAAEVLGRWPWATIVDGGRGGSIRRP